MDMSKYASTTKQKEEIIKDSPHSVKFSINAKGMRGGECKAYGQSPKESYLMALEIANKMEELIKQKNK